MLSGVVELACRFGVIALIPASTGFFGVCFADPAAWAGARHPAVYHLSSLGAPDEAVFQGRRKHFSLTRKCILLHQKDRTPSSRNTVFYIVLFYFIYASSSGIFFEQATASAPGPI